MTNLEKARARSRQSFWKALVGGYDERSGLTLTAYCKSKGVACASFYRWKRRLTAEEPTAFVPVKVRPVDNVQPDAPAHFKLRVNGAEFDLPTSMEGDALSRLLRVLGVIPC